MSFVGTFSCVGMAAREEVASLAFKTIIYFRDENLFCLCGHGQNKQGTEQPNDKAKCALSVLMCSVGFSKYLHFCNVLRFLVLRLPKEYTL